MKAIVGRRQTGKTTELIELSAEGGYYIVCHSWKEANRVYAKAIEMGLRIPVPITHEEFLGRRFYGRGIRGFLIDNVDMLLARLSPVPIMAFTVTIVEEKKLMLFEEAQDEDS